MNAQKQMFALFDTVLLLFDGLCVKIERGDTMNQDFIITKIERVILVGKHEYEEVESSFSRDHKYNELIFQLSGQATVHYNGKVLEPQANTVRFLPKGKNTGHTVVRKEPGDCIDVYFDTDRPISAEAFVMKCQKSEAVRNLFKKIFSVWVGKGEGYYFECISLLYRIFAELQKQDYIPEKQYRAIEPAIKYIQAHFLKNKIAVNDLAACCGISPSYLKRLFIKKFGMPPSKYIINLKINYACDLLQSGLYNITQIAEICGYSDIYFFSRQFKEYRGISPTAFIEKYKSSK